MILAVPRLGPRLSLLVGQLKYTGPHRQKPLGALLPSSSSSSTSLPPSSYPHPAAHFPSAVPASSAPFSTLGINASSDRIMAQYAHPPQPPPLFTATPDSLAAEARRLCDKTRALLDGMVAAVSADSATFANTVRPMVDNGQEDAAVETILGFYQYVSADPALRKASLEADKVLSDFGIETVMREDVFRLVNAVYRNTGLAAAVDAHKGQGPDEDDKPIDDATAKGLGLEDAETARLLQKMYKSYVLYGLSLPAGEKRDRFKAIKKRLADLAIDFNKNLNEENGGLWLTRDELAGVPADVVDSLEQGAGDNAGKLKLTFKYPDLIPTTRYATSADVRQRVQIGDANKVLENLPLFEETMVLRDEAARMLGYPDHATLRIEDKMVKSPKFVMDFLTDLQRRLAPGGTKEVKHLLEIKKKDLESRGEPFDGNFYSWDTAFYSRMMKEREYSIDENAVAEYFPLASTLSGMLRTFEELFGLVFVELGPEERARLSPTGKGEDLIWHEDVIMFSVWNDASEGDGFVGYFYLDLHPRPGKYGHAANFGLVPGFEQIGPDGTKSRAYPATSLICNFSKATAKKPALLKHHEVVTLFHELGHGIHDLVGRCRYARFHGTATVRDFVEAPSQMLENWCWTASTLRRLSSHWDTGAPIADELIDRLIATKHVNEGVDTTRQLQLGLFDMAVHTPRSHDEARAADTTVMWNKMRRDVTGAIGIKDTTDLGKPLDYLHGQTTFGHLIGGYDAGYFGYLTSEVYSVDMFHSVFRKNLMDGAEGRRYRHMVLEKGGSQDEMLTLEQFLGRRPSSDAFYKELGLEK